MGRGRSGRKRRTRQHVIAELACNHVERQALACGYSVERIEHDYGIDLVLFPYDANGEIENGQVFLQVKATDDLRLLADRETVALPVRRTDLRSWLLEPMPVMLVIYDAQAVAAYWLYVQSYFEGRPGIDVLAQGGTVTVHVNRANLLDERAIRAFARYRDAVLRQIQGVIRHHEREDDE